MATKKPQIPIEPSTSSLIRLRAAGLTNSNLGVTIGMKNVVAYVRPDSTCPYEAWFGRLDAQAAKKIAFAELRLEQGNLSSIKWFEDIGEYKIDWGPGYRIYLAQDGDTLIVLFGGGTKKRQCSDIKQALELHEEYKTRKKAEVVKKNRELTEQESAKTVRKTGKPKRKW